MEKEQAEQAVGFKKLLGDPGPFDLEVGGKTIKAWMRNLTLRETLNLGAVMLETREAVMDNGSDEKYAVSMGLLAIKWETVRLCLYRKENGPAVFDSAAEVSSLPSALVDTIYNEFNRRYTITEEELGNLLRARINGSETKLNSPDTSQV